MIWKSLSRSKAANPSQLINYVTRYALKHRHSSKDKDEATIILTHNLKSNSIEKIIEEYKVNESFRIYNRKNVAVLFHDIISFSPQDKNFVTDKVLKDIANKYTSLRAKNSLCLIVSHRNKTAHTHLHAIVSGVQLNGYSSRVSKQEFNQIVNELEQYQQQKHSELIHSRNIHKKNITKSKEEIFERVKKTRQTTKEKLIKLLDDAYTRSISSKDFLNRLSDKHELYYRNNRLQGIILDGKKFRISRLGFDDDKMQLLDHISYEDKSLLELETIRNNRAKKMKRDILKKKPNKEFLRDLDERRFMNQLSNVRQESADLQINDPTIERPFYEYEINSNNNNNEPIANECVGISSSLNFVKPKFIEHDFA